MACAFLSEDGLEEDVLPTQASDIIINALCLLLSGLVNGKFLVVFERVEFVGE